MNIFGIELDFSAIKDFIWDSTKPPEHDAPITPDNGVSELEKNEDYTYIDYRKENNNEVD